MEKLSGSKIKNCKGSSHLMRKGAQERNSLSENPYLGSVKVELFTPVLSDGSGPVLAVSQWMRSLFRSTFPFLILAGLHYSGLVQAGGDSAGGGDALAMEFTSLGQRWEQILAEVPENERIGIDLKKFHQAVEKTLVRTKDTAYFKGEVDAVNFSRKGKIILNGSRWSDRTRQQRLKIALHEYLGVLKLDRNYEISGPLASKYEDLAFAPMSSGLTPIQPAINGCLPIDKPINVFMSNVRFDEVNLIAGQLPDPSRASESPQGGAVVLGGTQVVSNPSGSKALHRSSVDGEIDFVVTPYCDDGKCNQANLVGTITIDPLTVADIRNKKIGVPGEFSGSVESVQKSDPCVSGIAIDLSHYGPVLYGGRIYLYMNHTQHGYGLYVRATDRMDKNPKESPIQTAQWDPAVDASRAL